MRRDVLAPVHVVDCDQNSASCSSLKSQNFARALVQLLDGSLHCGICNSFMRGPQYAIELRDGLCTFDTCLPALGP